MQEEENDDEEPEPSSPLNRRGSKSEGRINIMIQDRLSAEVAERLKKENQVLKAVIEPDRKTKARVGIIDGIAGIKIIRNDSSKEKFLGAAGAGCRKEVRSGSVDKAKPSAFRGQSDMKFLTESSTISIPAINVSSASANQIAKPYKTMPSPTKAAVGSNSNSSCLKEIFEECDAGSSDNNSNTNTPRAILRSQAHATHHRRTKFHKSRTTSGSSTDGSDDDNAEKKRATKMIDSAIAKQFTQRRDSHDDSSDSQDPGTTCSGNGNAGSSLILRNGSSSTTSNNKSSSQGEGSHQEDRGKTTSNSNEIGYRKHRTGRRRQTETRLRESQSLNRITEVQECEHNNNSSSSNAAHYEKLDKSKDGEVSREAGEEDKSKVATLNQLNSKHSDGIVNATNELKANKNHNNSKAKGFSARFLQNLNFKRNHDASQATVKSHQKSNRNSMEVPIAALKMTNGKMSQNLRTPNQMPNDGSDRSKKIKILGRYFQVSSTILQQSNKSITL